jgi:isopentenyl-diphosphate delta-isomerase
VTTPESVVLLAEDGTAIGTLAKREAHHGSTPLHLAFSLYLFDAAGRVLITRRALHKPTWPGAWTNTCCGHPGPGEHVADAAVRRVRQELGVGVVGLKLVLPRFRYRAVMADGTVENEMCPVFVGTTTDRPAPDPAEVSEVAWQDWPTFRAAVLDGSRAISPWCREQVAELPADPVAAPAGEARLLPAAAHGDASYS